MTTIHVRTNPLLVQLEMNQHFDWLAFNLAMWQRERVHTCVGVSVWWSMSYFPFQPTLEGDNLFQV